MDRAVASTRAAQTDTAISRAFAEFIEKCQTAGVLLCVTSAYRFPVPSTSDIPLVPTEEPPREPCEL